MEKQEPEVVVKGDVQTKDILGSLKYTELKRIYDYVTIKKREYTIVVV